MLSQTAMRHVLAMADVVPLPFFTVAKPFLSPDALDGVFARTTAAPASLSFGPSTGPLLVPTGASTKL